LNPEFDPVIRHAVNELEKSVPSGPVHAQRNSARNPGVKFAFAESEIPRRSGFLRTGRSRREIWPESNPDIRCIMFELVQRGQTCRSGFPSQRPVLVDRISC